MILAYLDVIGTDSVTLQTVSGYLDFIVARAAGELLTPATWMREYIRSHPDYKFDSVLSSRIAADLMAKCHRMGQGIEKARTPHPSSPSPPLPPSHTHIPRLRRITSPLAGPSSEACALVDLHCCSHDCRLALVGLPCPPVS